MAATPTILKADGTVEVFDKQKLIYSLRRTGAGQHTAEHIADTITRTIVPGAESREIYRRAFTMLRQQERPAAARYGLRRALLEFGPSGHPFEDFIAELFKAEGWHVEWRKVIQGKCVSHEVDLYATRGNETIAGELKYHNNPSYKTDVKIALYVKARFDDIWQCDPKTQTCPVDRGILVTNTKFTSQAEEYANCVGMELLGWSYPQSGSLFDRIIAANVYPVTTLTMLRTAEKKLLIDKGIVTAGQIREHRDVLRALHIPAERIGEIIAECDRLHEGLVN
jgi:hypothetical protein